MKRYTVDDAVDHFGQTQCEERSSRDVNMCTIFKSGLQHEAISSSSTRPSLGWRITANTVTFSIQLRHNPEKRASNKRRTCLPGEVR